MILYITVAVSAILIASKIESGHKNHIIIQGGVSRDKQGVSNRICFAGLFTLLFVVSALRIQTGNDYQTYIDRFHDIVCGNYVVTEPGFNLIVTAIYLFFQKEVYLVVFAVFAFLTIGVFLRALYEQSPDFQMSFFLFMALGIYFQTFNTVRYYFALALVLYSMRYVLRKEYVKFILMIMLAMLFHKSALVVIPLFLLARMNWKKGALIFFGFFALTGLFLEDFYMQVILYLYPSYIHEEEYLLAGSFSIVNIIRCIAVLVLALYCYKDAIRDSEENRFYFYLNLGALALYTCFTFIPFVSRIGYYLNISHLFFIPALLRAVPKRKKMWKILVVAAGILYFAAFLYKATDVTVKILPYSTWIFEEVEFVPLFESIQY